MWALASLIAAALVFGAASPNELPYMLLDTALLWPLTVAGLGLGAMVLSYRKMLAMAIGCDLMLIGVGMVAIDLLAAGPRDFFVDGPTVGGIALSLLPLLFWAHVGHALRLAVWPARISWRQLNWRSRSR